MKWFMHLRKDSNKPVRHLTRDQAIEFYRETGFGKMQLGAVSAIENMYKGHKAYSIHFVVWGEEIDDKELFRRILKGDVKPAKGEL